MANETAKTEAKASTEERAKAEDKARVERTSAVGGAQAVAEAVKRVADAAVAAASRVEAAPQFDFAITGVRGGVFRIRGDNNLGASGSVLLNGKSVETTGWGASNIEGKLPSDAQSGEVIVQLDAQTRRTGYLRL